MSKWLAYILSFLIISTSCIPCTDEQTAIGESKQITSPTTSHSDQPTPSADFCSPLCFCNCCYSASVPFIVRTDLSIMPRFLEAAKAKNPLQAFVQPFFSIWQPPKV